MMPSKSFRSVLVCLLLLVCLSTSLISCGPTTTAPASTRTPTLSAQARLYLTAALDIMQQHSVNRKKINWTAFRQQTFKEANGAKTPAETYSAIRSALTALGDHHSSFFEPQASQQLGAGDITPDQTPYGRRLAPGIGYLGLPSFEASQQAAQQYALLAQDTIRRADQAGACGWIIDLRNNPGGNMWPMLAGVGPILGEGVVGWFVDPDGIKQAWSYVDGQAQVAGSTVIDINNPYHLKRPDPPVAVLTSSLTASSGEAIVVAFRGRPHTRSFGDPTAGVPTANEGFQLNDDAVLLLTVALDADRTGHTYDRAIIPDQSEPAASSQTDLGLQAATIWLHDQEGCQAHNPHTPS